MLLQKGVQVDMKGTEARLCPMMYHSSLVEQKIVSFIRQMRHNSRQKDRLGIGIHLLRLYQFQFTARQPIDKRQEYADLFLEDTSGSTFPALPYKQVYLLDRFDRRMQSRTIINIHSLQHPCLYHVLIHQVERTHRMFGKLIRDFNIGTCDTLNPVQDEDLSFSCLLS